MKHSDFDDQNGLYRNWQIHNWPKAVRIALGLNALLVFRVALLLALTPTLMIAGYSIYAERPILLVWAALGFLGFQSGSNAPTGIGAVFFLLLAAIGLVISLMYSDRTLFICGIVPGATWFGSCVIMGTTAQYLIDAIRSSETSLQTLTRQGILTAESNAE